ncbi:tetratricopeptide repeat protein 33 [Corythoichthys intestinalis]|uniref:tetratricopeptide repeat protein 33 n=1 Tax=Corythoichthys intestinalis TaxID=161448 RepID=UPI0025A63211|nr:tetratricopeptide repeat protein 33 [Corythoichthys intestinalis]XP_057675725.1 tetratricopeptide repeat protein 33 [Corythoichthys intestinalis]
MASFGWKRKAGEKVSKSAALQFEESGVPAAGATKRNGDGGRSVDWQQAVKRRREVLLEDCAAKSKTLKEEGAVLAQQNRHWEAVKKWDEAIQLTPDDPLLYEMKAQVLTTLREVFPAVKAAETAVKLRTVWWEAWQTLGRAQLSMGEVDMALRSFQVAVHLCPWERTLREDDLAWARTLHRQKATAGETLGEPPDNPELHGDFDFESDEVLEACEAIARSRASHNQMGRLMVDSSGNVLESAGEPADPSPENFIQMRRL